MLPTGTVTFLFTDVEGSTRLWEEAAEAMRAALARHDGLVEELSTRHGGVVVRPRGEGDSRFCVFARASDGVMAAGAIQRALAAESWATPRPIRVRMALHTGEADLRDGDYYGGAVNRCARIRAIAHGGQVLLSGATAAVARGGLADGLALRELGRHRLRDLGAPEEVFQLVGPELADGFPPLKSLDTLPNNLPGQVTTFVGRERELIEVSHLLASTRLVTLAGTGGCGKTRLALEVAGRLADNYPGGVWFVDLAPIADEALVPRTVAAVLGLVAVEEDPGRDVTDAIVDALRGEPHLLILDNCEHLVAPCAGLAETLLRSCPPLTILATSRELLGASGEAAWRVPSLSLPPAPGTAPVEALEDYEAVRLFVERARVARSGFSVTAANTGALAQICRRVDGIPLALELAAARVRVLTVEQIAARLDDRFHLLTGGARTALRRQQTLRATIDWSYDLLSDAERALLRRLAVFAGGWSLEAAEEVCSDEVSGVESEQILDLLTGLVDKSLVVADEAGDEVRYSLLETLRQYAGEKLADPTSGHPGEAAAVRDRHLAWYLALAERAEPELKQSEQVLWLDRLEAEHDNLRSALDWATTRRDGDRALRLAAALGLFWDIRGHVAEGTGRVVAALEVHGDAPEAPTPALAWSLAWAAVFASRGGDNDAARVYAERCLPVSRALKDLRPFEIALGFFAQSFHSQGAEGAALLDESFAAVQSSADRWAIADALRRRAVRLHFSGPTTAARPMLEEALRLSRAVGDLRLVALTLEFLGVCAYFGGELDEADRWFDESLSAFGQLRDQSGMGRDFRNLARVCLGHGDLARARDLLGRSIAIHRRTGSLAFAFWSLESFAGHAALAGDPARALKLAGAADAIRQRLGRPMPPGERSELAGWLATARSALFPAEAEAAWEAGRRLGWQEAVDLAVSN